VSWVLSTFSWGCDGACPGAVPPSAQAWANIVLGLASMPGCLWLAMGLEGQASHEQGFESTVQDDLLRLAPPSPTSGNAHRPDAAAESRSEAEPPEHKAGCQGRAT